MITTTINQTSIESMDNTAKLNQFFIAHEKKAYAIAFMSLNNQEDALDVVQDVMIKFVQKYSDKEKSCWVPLFYRMINNKVTDFHRANTKKNKLFSFPTNNEEQEEPLSNFEDKNQIDIINQINNEMTISHLQIALNDLPTRQLQSFMCRIWEGLSVAETAQSMKCSQGSVKTHLFRALSNLRSKVNTNE